MDPVAALRPLVSPANAYMDMLGLNESFISDSVQVLTKAAHAPYSLLSGEKFDVEFHRQWFKDYWHLSIYLVAIYLLGCYYGQKFMANRRPYNLRWVLFVWSAVLAVFSALGTRRTLPELIHSLQHHGFRSSICDDITVQDVDLVGYWLVLFGWSKVIELIDTAFIIARKQKLITLHWFHHALTLFSCFYWAREVPASVRWFATLNYAIHTAMYTYYALRALKIHVPRIFAVTITLSQLVQMFIGFYINIILYKMKSNNETCAISLPSARLGVSGYIAFFVLFLNFFFHTYVFKSKAAKVPAKVE